MKKWEKKEKKDSEDFNARKTPRSGGLWGFKGDEINEDLLIESKHTQNKSFSITNKLWDKVYKQALRARKIPLLSIELGNSEEVVVLSKHDFIGIYEIWKKNKKKKNNK